MACKLLNDEAGRVIGFVCGPGIGQKKCACGRPSLKLCDGPAPENSGRATCDTALCRACAVHVPYKDLDYCGDHRSLATA